MFARMSRGWGIVKSSWSILKRYPSLLVLPLFSGIAVLLLFGSIIWSIHSMGGDQSFELFAKYFEDDVLAYGAAFLFYFACFFIIIFFNAALVFCALDAFADREPSVMRGISRAIGRLPQIIAWALVATTVGLLLRVLQNFLKEKLGIIGALMGGLLEFGWAVMTYFVVPVLVVEGVGPFKAIKQSATILKQTWGEALVGEGGLGIIAMLFTLPVFLLIALAGSMGFVPGGVWVLGSIVLVWMIVISVVFTALSAIFQTGTFLYATTGEAPTHMNQALMESAFRPKK